MRESLLEKLCCPIDLGLLKLTISHQDQDGHIIHGKLRCQQCQRIYPVKRGIPHMFLADNVIIDGDALTKLQENTVKCFGFEWWYFRDWGWLIELPNVPNAKEKFYGGLVENTRSAYWGKTLFQREELYPGLLVLDAGCGNGRFTNQAALTGVEVIGVDLGWGVESAFEHTRQLPNVHIIRGDIFQLPFASTTFDRIFSISVLQHTGNAGAAFDSMAKTLKVGGLMLAHVYGKGRRTYELLDAMLRAVTTRLPISKQLKFARMTAGLSRWLRSGGKHRTAFYWWLFSHINLLPTEHHMFDWCSAPIATHYTPDEVQAWFSRNQLKIIRCNPSLGDTSAERTRLFMHGSISVLGQRQVTHQV